MPFSQKSIDFLIENKIHDSKEWYQEHKGLYVEFLLEPFVELAARLGPAMLKIDPQLIVEPRVDRTLSRIYRDTRFSKDKSLYRENMWMVFMREKKLYEGLPAFYFDLSPQGFSYGMGYYQASAASMEAIRQMVLDSAAPYKKADKVFRKQDIFSMEGEAYKRSKYPDLPLEKREWLDKKNISINCHSGDFDLLFSERLSETLSDGFLLLAPIYDFLCLAEVRRGTAKHS